MIHFNINDHMFVQLTQAGRQSLEKQHVLRYKETGIQPIYTPPDEDCDGWSCWKMAELIDAFGCMIKEGGIPFESEVKIDV